MNSKDKAARAAVLPAALMMAAIWESAGQAETPAMLPSRNEAPRSGSHYADEVYSATGQYGGQPSFITVTVTLVDDVIADVAVTPHAYVPAIAGAAAAVRSRRTRVVIGRRIDQVKVGKLAGSSGTPVGFNAALDQIRQQALNP